jgi:hypothetical protein
MIGKRIQDEISTQTFITTTTTIIIIIISFPFLTVALFQHVTACCKTTCVSTPWVPFL